MQVGPLDSKGPTTAVRLGNDQSVEHCFDLGDATARFLLSDAGQEERELVTAPSPSRSVRRSSHRVRRPTVTEIGRKFHLVFPSSFAT